MNIKLQKQKMLDDLYAPYLKCKKCPLANLGRTQVVFGDGNPDAKLMFIGEGPGQDEDKKGIPFIGRAGQLLNKVLELCEIERNSVFITNIVKCRPPDNRKPLPPEATTCKSILLDKQIQIIQPKIICTLGAAAIQGLLDDYTLKITKIRGSRLTDAIENCIVIPAYHPAYILRNPKELNYLYQDILLAKNLIDKP